MRYIFTFDIDIDIDNKTQSFINRNKRAGYCSPDLPDFDYLCTSLNRDMFNKVFKMSYIYYYHSIPLLLSDMAYDPECTTGHCQSTTENLPPQNVISKRILTNFLTIFCKFYCMLITRLLVD